MMLIDVDLILCLGFLILRLQLCQPSIEHLNRVHLVTSILNLIICVIINEVLICIK